MPYFLNTSPHKLEWEWLELDSATKEVLELFSATPSEQEVLFYSDLPNELKPFKFVKTRFVFTDIQLDKICKFFRDIKSNEIYMFTSKITADALLYSKDRLCNLYGKKIHLLGVVRKDRKDKTLTNKINYYGVIEWTKKDL